MDQFLRQVRQRTGRYPPVVPRRGTLILRREAGLRLRELDVGGAVVVLVDVQVNNQVRSPEHRHHARSASDRGATWVWGDGCQLFSLPA